jgi:hypothetical protein
MVLTGGLIIYLVRKYSNNPPTRRLVVALAVLTTLTIATSIYIGSHWVTDLIGGALVGGLLLQAVIVIDRATTSPQTRHPAAPVIEVPGQSGRSSTAGDGAAAALARGRSAEVVEDVTDVLPASSASEARRTRAD